MGERKTRLGALKGSERTVVGHAAKRDNCLKIGHLCNAGGKKSAASGDLSGCRFVLWWYATHRISDHAVNELEVVVNARLIAAFGEAEIQKRGIEEFTGGVAREWTASAICALEPRRKTDDEKARVQFPK